MALTIGPDLRLRQGYDPLDEADEYHLRLLKRQPRSRHYGGFNHGLGVTKQVQHVVLVPPDAAISISKHLQHLVLVPPDAALSLAKHVQYFVLEAAPLPDMARPKALRYRLGWPDFVVDGEEPRGLTPWSRRFTSPDAYVGAVPTAPPPIVRWLAGGRLQDDIEFLPRPLRTRPSRSSPRTDAFVPVIIVN